MREQMRRLLNNKDFKEVFIDYYLNKRVKELVFNENLKNEETIVKLQSIQELRKFIEYLVGEALWMS